MTNTVPIMRGLPLDLEIQFSDTVGPINITGGTWTVLESRPDIVASDITITDAVNGKSRLFVGSSRTLNFKSGRHLFRAICNLPGDTGIPLDVLAIEVT